MEIEFTFYHEFPVAWDIEGVLEYDEVELLVSVEIEPNKPAITWGPADNWCPAEGGSNVESITLNGEDWSGTLDASSQAQLEDALNEAYIDTLDGPDEDDYDDRFFDDHDTGAEVEWESRV